uniref:Uncharacterized protein n=1 Tax=Strigamia maritima TaxID=126957 RepID=T1IHY7_STRMM
MEHVKLYVMNDEGKWENRGTGQLSCLHVERLEGMSLLLQNESDASLLLESKIQPDINYEIQRDSFIVWTEGEDIDFALNFPEKSNCVEMWEEICQIQEKSSSLDITQELIDNSDDENFDLTFTVETLRTDDLPTCELSNLEEINAMIDCCLPEPILRDKIAVDIKSEKYIPKLLNIFHACEDSENFEGLNYLNEIFKNIFLLNKIALLEVMFSDDLILDVVGCLEFDSDLVHQPHREHLRNMAKLQEAIPISNPELISVIHRTYRAQYIRDEIFQSSSLFEALSSFIYYNKIRIVNLIQDETSLGQLFAKMKDDTMEAGKKRDLVLFLKEFCLFSQKLQEPVEKEFFFRTISSRFGILEALEVTLRADDPTTQSASIDILSYIVEFNSSIVRNYILQQQRKKELLINVVIKRMFFDGAVEMDILRHLIYPKHMGMEKEDFLNLFYKDSVHVLLAPLLAYTSDADYRIVELLSLVLKLLVFCVRHHDFHMKKYMIIINEDVLRKVLVLMESKHKFLVLDALRFMRRLIQSKDEFYYNYIIEGNLFRPVIDAFTRNNGRYNLLDSAIIEMFEFIRCENIRLLGTHLMENFSKVFDKVDYVQTFRELKERFCPERNKIKGRGDEEMWSSRSDVAKTDGKRKKLSVGGSAVHGKLVRLADYGNKDEFPFSKRRRFT